MVGRGALIKPWIFLEFKEGRELNPSTEDRIGELLCRWCTQAGRAG